MGGLKKIFSRDLFTLEMENSTIQDVIDYLIKLQSENSDDFNGKNVMIAINGKDSSALHGMKTVVKSGDNITIIPIIHGGENVRTQFKIDQNLIELFEISKSKKYDKNYLQKIRKKFSKLMIQSISSNYVLNKSHAKKIIRLSLTAKRKNTLLSQKLETDILLRFAGTTQINDAINNVGITKNQNFFLIGIGKKFLLDKLHRKILPNLNYPFLEDNSTFIKKYFRISDKNIKVVNSKTPLEDLLCENAAILI